MSTDLLWQGFSFYGHFFPFGKTFPVGVLPKKRVMYCIMGRKVWISAATVFTGFVTGVIGPGYLFLFRNFPWPEDNRSVTLLVLMFGGICETVSALLYLFIWLNPSATVKGFNNIVRIEELMKAGNSHVKIIVPHETNDLYEQSLADYWGYSQFSWYP